MTDHKALKNLVRERMSRTGESYTTAHRYVTARKAGRDVAGLTADYPAFGAEAHRPSGLAQHLLGQKGISVSEPMACGLGGGIGFLYAVFEYASVPHPLLTIVAQHHPQPWLNAVASHLGLELSQLTSSKAGPALQKLDAALENGNAAEVVVGRGMLPWHPGVPDEEAADPYAVVVAGKSGDEYLVDDGDGEPYRISAAALGEAWAAHRKGRFVLTTLRQPTAAPDLGAGIRAAITTTHAHLTGPVLGNNFDVNMGLSGMRRFARDLADTRTKTGWVKRFGNPGALSNGARRLAECLTWAHTSAGATRPLYAAFLAEAGPLAGLNLAPASDCAAESGQRWGELADVAGTVSPDDDPQEMIAHFATLMEAILPVEERLAAELGAAIGTGAR